MIRANKAIKKGDMVEVIAGRSKSKTGKVTKIITKTNMCLVEKVNMVKRHTKASQENPQGGIVDKEAPIHLSNVKLVSATVDKKPAKKEPAKKVTKKTAKKTTKEETKKKPVKKTAKKD
ncbi:MAG: 50S ribosomal protein L24 [Deltaproteobacteria bacterium]|nr:50S ribosomal protein L24 [Deltaproteobacteria bacterium]